MIAVNDPVTPVPIAMPAPVSASGPIALLRGMLSGSLPNGIDGVAVTHGRGTKTAWRYREHVERCLSDSALAPRFGSGSLITPAIAADAGTAAESEMHGDVIGVLAMVKDVAGHAFSTEKKACRRAVKTLVDIALNRAAAEASLHAERWLLSLYTTWAADKRQKIIVRRLSCAHRIFSKDVIACSTVRPADFAMPVALLHILGQHTWLAMAKGRCIRSANYALNGWDHLLLGALTGKFLRMSGVASPERCLSKAEQETAMKRAVCCLSEEIEINEEQPPEKMEGQVAQLAALAGRLKVAMAILRFNGERYLLVAERPDDTQRCTLMLVKTNDRLDRRAKQRLVSVAATGRSADLIDRLRRGTRVWMETEVRRRLGLADFSVGNCAFSRFTLNDDIEQKTPYEGEVILFTLMDEIEQSRIAGDVDASARIGALSRGYNSVSLPHLKTMVMVQRAKMFADAREETSGSRCVPPALHIRKNFVLDSARNEYSGNGGSN